MSRGNQRDVDRERAKNRKIKSGVIKKDGSAVGKQSGQDIQDKKERDRLIMIEKQKKAEERRAAEAAKK